MGDTITEFMALMKEFGTILQFNAVAGIAVAVLVFVLEVKWTHSHPPKDKQIEKAIRLDHVVNAKGPSFGTTASRQLSKQRRIIMPTISMRSVESSTNTNIWTGLFRLLPSSCIT